MRVALLSSIEHLSDDSRKLRAFVRIGGRTILDRQLDFALACKCELIVCLSEALHPELITLQRRAENVGARFQTIRDVRPLSGLVNAADELLVVADGLAFGEELALKGLGGGKTVVTLAAENAVPGGFERLDRDHAWGGLMIASGALVEQLAEMPADIDPQASLLRLALQSGTKMVPIPEQALAEHEWAIVDDVQKLAAFENRWLGAATNSASFLAPVSAIADRAALAVLKRHDSPGNAARAVGGLGYALLALALVGAYFGYAAPGFFAAALAGFAARFSLTITAILQRNTEQSKGGRILAKLPPLALDFTLIGLVLLAATPATLAAALFAALMLFGLLRLGVVWSAASVSEKLRHLMEDRGVLALLLGLGLLIGKLVVVIQLLAGLLLIGLLVQSYSVKLTRD